jgi:hypothetical protein
MLKTEEKLRIEQLVEECRKEKFNKGIERGQNRS